MADNKKKNNKGLRRLDVTTNEAILLLVGVALMDELIESIQIQSQESAENDIENLLQKLEGCLDETHIELADEILEELLNSFLPEVHISDIDDTAYTYPMYSIEEKLPIIERSIEKKRVLEIEYYSMAREDINTRQIEVYSMQQRKDYYVLIAYCRWREDIRLFRADRIKSLFITDDKFKIPDDFDLDTYIDEEYI